LVYFFYETLEAFTDLVSEISLIVKFH